ncbi:MAG: rhomboid family intramembrane serine protease [Bacteroidota bacterium]
MGGLSGAIKHLIIINVIIFIAGITGLGEMLYDYLALWFPKNPKFQYWQLFTHMFLHDFSGFMHILFNMYALWAFGTPLERMWGRNKFLFFYFSAGLGAALLHLGFNYYLFNSGLEALVNTGIPKAELMEALSSGRINMELVQSILGSDASNFGSAYYGSVVGASGAVYGVLVAFAFSYPNAELMLIFLPVPIKAKYFVPVLIAIDIFFGFSSFNTGIAHFAHVGGALIGFLMMWYWKRNQFNQNRWD